VRGAESYDRKKAWSSVNRLILSGGHCYIMVMPEETSPSETVIFKDPRMDFKKKTIPPAFIA
jgi:hypothetical protein